MDLFTLENLAHLKLFGDEIHAKSKANFYFVITVMVLVDVMQSRYRSNLMRRQKDMAQQAKS